MLFFIEAATYPTKQWGQSNFEFEIRQPSIRYPGLLGQWEDNFIYQASDVSSIIFISYFHSKFFAEILSIFFFFLTKIKRF
jgi:hypothetical protein